MKKHWKIAGIATLVVILAIVATGAVVLAQEPSDSTPSWALDLRQKFDEAVANALGISVDKYQGAVETAQKQVLDEAVAQGLLTQDQADKLQQRWSEGFGPGVFGGMLGRGFGLRGFIAGKENSLVSVAADKLGMTVSDLATELQGGKSIADVAKEKNVDPQTIADAYVTQLQQNLKQAVDNGRITQAQADAMLSQAQQRVTDQINSTWQGHKPGGLRGGVRSGRRGSFSDPVPSGTDL
jgi:hypothetical protein